METEGAMDSPQRPGLHAGVRTEFTVFTEIKHGHGQAVRDALRAATQDPRRADAVREIGTLHEARFVLLDDDTRLLFCSSFDGMWDKYIDDIAATYIATMFDSVFSHCDGFPGITDPDVEAWFMHYAREASTYIWAYPEATVKEVWQALAVQKSFQTVLDDPDAEQALQSPALHPLLELAAT
jgi:hypothetical protein